jgi:hypothetical protein
MVAEVCLLRLCLSSLSLSIFKTHGEPTAARARSTDCSLRGCWPVITLCPIIILASVVLRPRRKRGADMRREATRRCHAWQSRSSILLPTLMKNSAGGSSCVPGYRVLKLPADQVCHLGALLGSWLGGQWGAVISGGFALFPLLR